MSIVISLQFILYAVFIHLKFNLDAKEKGVNNTINQFIVVFAVISTFFIGFSLSGLLKKEEFINEEYILYVSMFLMVCIIFKYNISLLLNQLNSSKSDTDPYVLSDTIYSEFVLTNESSLISDSEEKLRQEIISVDEVGTQIEEIDISKTTDKYAKSRISDEDIQKGMILLQEALNDKIYLLPDLSVEILSKKLKIPSYNLTQIFTIGMNSNFNKVINSYRVNHAIELLNDPNVTDTIEEIGIDSGFNSRSSFYRAFKNQYEVTPSEYRKRIIRK